jgi:hypothetical protein
MKWNGIPTSRGTKKRHGSQAKGGRFHVLVHEKQEQQIEQVGSEEDKEKIESLGIARD